MAIIGVKYMYIFQIATNARGRGVLRLLLFGQRVNLLGIPALVILLFTEEDPSGSLPLMLCLFVRIVTIILGITRSVSDTTVALGRYV